MDNNTKDCPPLMSDGRVGTSYVSANQFHKEFRSKLGVNNSVVERQTIKNNGMKIAEEMNQQVMRCPSGQEVIVPEIELNKMETPMTQTRCVSCNVHPAE